MYDMKNLNIWKDKGIKALLKCKEIVLERDASRRKELFLGMKSAIIFEEMVKLVPEADFSEIKKRQGGKLRFPIYINEKNKITELETLELSVRSSNCLHRAGYKTVGELVESINGNEDLKKIRNCGDKSIDEIMEQLFCYQYRQLENDKKIKYIKRVLELNS